MNTVNRQADELLLQPTYWAKFHFDPPTSDVASAAMAPNEIHAQLMIVLTGTDYTARKIANYKPTVPVMRFFTTDMKVDRQLQIHRGPYPVVPDSLEQAPATAVVIAYAKKIRWLSSNNRVVVIS